VVVVLIRLGLAATACELHVREHLPSQWFGEQDPSSSDLEWVWIHFV